MAYEPSVQTETEFVFRRLTDPLQWSGKEISPYWWLAILIPVVLAAAAYVGWMYVRDSRTIGWRWATLLGLLRCGVYGLLAWVFLLPAWQKWEKTESRSKVVLLMDVSGSTGTKDDLPTESLPIEKLLSRQDKVIQFLTDDQVKFLERLQEQNPVSLYRFGSQIDDTAREFKDGENLTAAEWSVFLKPDPKEEMPKNLKDEEKATFLKKIDLHTQLVNGTNIGEALLAALKREAGNMLQGIIVVSDGRSTQFSNQTFEAVRAKALNANVPIFTVIVGEHRQPINIRITDLQAPDNARPDDKFLVRVEVDGEGLGGRDVKVSLDIFHPGLEPKPGKQPTLVLQETARFQQGEVPHAQVEFQIDPETLAELRKVDTETGKPELEEGTWNFIARVEKDKREVFLPKEHVSEPAPVNVVKKPLRVLLFASSPGIRDYQFARAMFVREVAKGRAELSLCLQLARPEIVQDVEADRMLTRFPTTLRAIGDDPKEKGEDKYENLAQYDLIIAFDPDWTQLGPETMANLEKWVGTHAGGLIVVGGPVNTFQLARGVNHDRLKPILNLYPVYLEDSRLLGLGGERTTTEPWRLNFPGATPDMEFLKLDDESKETLSGWEEFFTGMSKAEGGKDAGVRRGFYNYYPVKMVKPTATTVATFTDPRARLSDGKEQPYLVTMPYGTGKVVWLGSAEIWRLRQYREMFHERFWTKLGRSAGSGNLTRLNRRGVLVMGKTYMANNPVRLKAQLFGPDLQPLPKTEKPKAEVKFPDGAKATVALLPSASQGADWNGWYDGRLDVTAAGKYEIRLQVPGSTEVLSSKFDVKESNPELDNTQPDFAGLRQFASEASDVLARVNSEDIRGKVKTELERTNQIQASRTSDQLRLFFDLKGAQKIPDCMVIGRKSQINKGPIEDVWDRGWILDDSREPPTKLSYALCAIVGLLSLEWLTRKLLKLA